MRATELHIPEPCSCLRSQIAYQMIGSHMYFSADPTEPTDTPCNNVESGMSGVSNPICGYDGPEHTAITRRVGKKMTSCI